MAEQTHEDYCSEQLNKMVLFLLKVECMYVLYALCLNWWKDLMYVCDPQKLSALEMIACEISQDVSASLYLTTTLLLASVCGVSIGLLYLKCRYPEKKEQISDIALNTTNYGSLVDV
jgi:hypothetical protein